MHAAGEVRRSPTGSPLTAGRSLWEGLSMHRKEVRSYEEAPRALGGNHGGGSQRSFVRRGRRGSRQGEPGHEPDGQVFPRTEQGHITGWSEEVPVGRTVLE